MDKTFSNEEVAELLEIWVDRFKRNPNLVADLIEAMDREAAYVRAYGKRPMM